MKNMRQLLILCLDKLDPINDKQLIDEISLKLTTTDPKNKLIRIRSQSRLCEIFKPSDEFDLQINIAKKLNINVGILGSFLINNGYREGSKPSEYALNNNIAKFSTNRGIYALVWNSNYIISDYTNYIKMMEKNNFKLSCNGKYITKFALSKELNIDYEEFIIKMIERGILLNRTEPVEPPKYENIFIRVDGFMRSNGKIENGFLLFNKELIKALM